MELGKLFVTIAADTKALTAGLAMAKGEIQKTTAGMGAQFKALGIGMVAVGALITAAFGLTVKAAITEQKELAQVSTMLDDLTMKYMPEFAEGLDGLAIEFGDSSAALSKGLYDILSASIDPAKALGVLAEASKAAVAGITDTGVAADAITTVLNSYGLEAEDAGKVSDQLFAIVKRGKTTFAELAPAIGTVSATAHMAGFSFEDLGASIAVITRAGIDTNAAMTAINGVLKSFLKPQKDSVEVAKEFGLELNTNTLKTIGLTGVMGKLKDATAEQLAIMFGSIRGLKGIAAALGDAEGYGIDYALMLNSVGLTQVAFDKQAATVGFQLGRLKQAFGVLAEEIGAALLPVIGLLTKGILAITSAMVKFMKEHPTLTKAIVLLGATLGVLVGTGGAIIMGVLAFGKLQGALATAKIGFLALKTAILSLEIGAGLGLILAAVASFIVAYKTNFLGLKTWADNFWETLKEGWKSYVKFVYDMEAEIGAAFITAGMAAKESAKNIEAFGNAIQIAKEAGTGAFQTSQFTDLATALDLVNAKAEDYGITTETLSKKMEALTTDFDLSQKYITDSNQAILNSIQYYKEMIGLMANLSSGLNIELSLLEAGSDEYKEKAIEIDKNVKAMNEMKAALEAIITPLEGLDLIAAKMALLGDSTEDSKMKIGLLEERIGLLRIELEKAPKESGLFYDLKKLIKDDEQAIKDLNAEILQTKVLANLGSQLDYVTKKFAEGEPTVTGYKEQIGILNKELAIAKDKLAELKPEDVGYWEAKTAVEEYEKKIKDTTSTMNDFIINGGKLKDSLRDIGDVAKETGDAIKEAGEEGQSSWEMLGGTIQKATIALSNFTKEGLVATIVNAKMAFMPLFADINEALASMKKAFLQGEISAVDYNALQVFYLRQENDLYKELNEKVKIYTAGLNDYLKIMAAISGESPGSIKPISIPSYDIGTPSVPKTGLAVVHKGEEINPVGQRSYDYSNKYNININNPTVRNDNDIIKIRQEVEKVLDKRQFLRRGSELAFGM